VAEPRCAGVAGLGFLGRGIATCLINHGFHVIALETQPVTFGSHLFTRAESARDLACCEFVIESITEDLSAKQALFDDLEAVLNPAAPIASNTSAIPITRLQAGRKYPNRFAGMHWAPPAEQTRFMEIIRGEFTDDATIQKLLALAFELDKEPGVVQKDIPGFVANRLAYAIYREAIHLLEQGIADVETIDLLCRNSLGLWAPIFGPFRWIDITGGPAIYAKAMENIIPTLSNQADVPLTMQRRSETNERFYNYAATELADWQKKLKGG
jgi:3-hydroxybutyryl-CoA dehydrogenase